MHPTGSAILAFLIASYDGPVVMMIFIEYNITWQKLQNFCNFAMEIS